MFPDWASGVVGIIAAIAIAQIAVFRIAGQRGRRNLRIPESPPGPEYARITQALDDIQRRLAELEERVDFTERLLAAQRETGKLAK
jgi:hypothetical protein